MVKKYKYIVGKGIWKRSTYKFFAKDRARKTPHFKWSVVPGEGVFRWVKKNE